MDWNMDGYGAASKPPKQPNIRASEAMFVPVLGDEYKTVNVRRRRQATVTGPAREVVCHLCGQRFDDLGKQAKMALRVHMVDVHKADMSKKKGGGKA